MTNPYQSKPEVQLEHPHWSKDSVIYQINTRQFTPEGTFSAAAGQLPRLKELGVDILWLMPVHPIGELNRKGSLGSPYAVKDYFAVNSEFGDIDDLTAFVSKAHKLGMYVILDWVANHSAWDNHLVEQFPHWYATDYKGDYRPTPWWDWSDIIDFDYQHSDLREYMTRAMRFWVEHVDIDGYRCDVAGFVPTDFWVQVRKELEAIKPVFMLAEWESRDLHYEAFDMTYAWSWNEVMHGICQGKTSIYKLYKYYAWNEKAFPKEAIRMTFVSNHDKNAWDGTQSEQFGPGLEATIVLSVVGEGMPLIHNGQEAGESKRLKFFERDPIEWQPHHIGRLYKDLIQLKKSNSALWNGQWGARMIHIPNSHNELVFSFVRQNAQDKVFALFNFSQQTLQVRFDDALYHGRYQEVFSQSEQLLDENSCLELAPWDYRVYVK